MGLSRLALRRAEAGRRTSLAPLARADRHRCPPRGHLAGARALVPPEEGAGRRLGLREHVGRLGQHPVGLGPLLLFALPVSHRPREVLPLFRQRGAPAEACVPVCVQLTQCTAPPAQPGDAMLEISINSASYSTDGVAYRYYDTVAVLTLQPQVGPLLGGTNVSVIGTNLLHGSTCRIRIDISCKNRVFQLDHLLM